MHTDILILGARRTPIGAMLGSLAPIPVTELGSTAIAAALADARIDTQLIDEVIMGCVLPAGAGQAPARQAALGAGVPLATGCMTINKVCGSGMKSVMLARDSIAAGSQHLVVAGGMESMTNAPHLLPKARAGYRLGHGKVLDHMMLDGLENPSDNQPMGFFGEQTAKAYEFSREAQDEFARNSVIKALAAMDGGNFKAELAPVRIADRKGERFVDEDEEPRRIKLEKIPHLRPAFARDGTVTAASSSKISDGAAALVVASESFASDSKLEPIARIVGQATHSQEPEWFTTAPIHAMRKLFAQTGWDASDIDLYEINEAFAVVAMAAIRDLDLDAAKVNVHGGACALGHPIGCSGARLLVTLVHALRTHGKKRGVAALCIGGGEATAVAVEVL